MSTGSFIGLQATTTNTSILNASTCTFISLQATTTNTSILNVSTGSFIGLQATTTNTSVLNASTCSFIGLQASTINTSILNASTATIISLQATTTNTSILNASTCSFIGLQATTTNTSILNASTGTIIDLRATTTNTSILNVSRATFLYNPIINSSLSSTDNSSSIPTTAWVNTFVNTLLVSNTNTSVLNASTGTFISLQSITTNTSVLNASTATFLINPKINSSLSNSDNSSSIPTTAWVKGYVTNALSTIIITSNASTINTSTIYVNTIQPTTVTSAMTLGSNLSGGTLAIGSGTSTTTLNGVTTFTSQPLITSTILASTNNSTSIPTTAWVNSWFLNILLYVSNVWTLIQTFAGGILLNSISTIAITDTLTLASTQTTGNILIGNGASRTGGIVIGGNGAAASASTITIGSSTTTSAFNGSTIFSTNPKITSLLVNSDNSSSIPSTAWVRTYVGTTLANISSTIGNASIINGSTLSILTINSVTQTSALTLGSNLSGGTLTIGSLTSSTIVTGPTTFSTNPIISSSLSTADNSSRVPTTAWVKTYFATFTSSEILNTLYAGTAYIVTGTAYVSKIQANSSTSVFTICDNLTSGSLTIGSSTASNTILGTTTFSNNPIINSSLSITDNSSSIPTTAWVNTFLTGALNSYNQTISTLYAGTAYIITGTMYTTRIQANSSTTPFSICDNLTTGTLSIGSATTTTTILGTLISNNIQGTNISSAMVFGTNLSGGSLTIGSSNASTIFNSYPLINSAPLLSTDNSSSIPTTSWVKTNFGGLNSTNVWSSNQAFGTYIQTGDLLALYVAPITLYGNTTSTLSLGSTCSTITIGGSQTSGTVNIGSLTSTTRILGTTNVSVFNSSTAKFESVDSNATTLNIGTTNATTINVGKSNTEVNIATASSRSAILDLGNGASSTGAVLINNGTSSSGDTQIMNAATQSGSLTLGNSANTVTIALNRPLTPGYTYPISSPSQIGWTQSVNTGFTASFTTSVKTYACNTTSMPPGFYSINFFVYIQNGQLAAGGNILTVLQGSNSFKGNGTLVSAGGVTDPNGGTYGYHLLRTYSQTGFNMDTTLNLSWIINNTNTGGSQYLPFMFLAINVTSASGTGAYVDATFTRIA